MPPAAAVGAGRWHQAARLTGLPRRCTRAPTAVVAAIPDDGRRLGGSDDSEPPADAPSTRQRRGAAPAATTLKQEAVASNREVSDKLIEVFRSKKPADWRKLIAYSRQWAMLAPGVLER